MSSKVSLTWDKIEAENSNILILKIRRSKAYSKRRACSSSHAR
jgi:hypothetical protein